MVFPAVYEQIFEVAHGKEVAEEDLVAEDGFAADDEGKGEGDGEFEFERFEAGHVVFFVDGGFSSWCTVSICGFVLGGLLVEAFDVHDTHH